MEIRLNRIEFQNELVPMQGIVERRTTIPILSHLLLHAVGDRLRIAATDLDVSLESWCEGEIQEEGAIAIQAKKLYEIIRASASEDLILRIDQEGVLSIVAGKSRFKIHGLPAEDFPTLPTLEEEDPIEFAIGDLRAMIAKIIFAISHEESRFQLGGALMRFDDGVLALVATDGHRLSLVERNVEGLEARDSVLVPKKVMQELQRFEGEDDVQFVCGDHHLAFTVGRRKLTCRILEGAFPDYERVISRDHDKHVFFERKALTGVFQRVSLLTGDRIRAVRLELRSGQLVLSAANPDLGEATEEIACDYDGPDISLGVNPDYLIQFMGATDSEMVRLEFKDSQSQCIAHPVEGPDREYMTVIMPVRL